MAGDRTGSITRRGFAAAVMALFGMKPLLPLLQAAGLASGSADGAGLAPLRYRTFNPREGALVERIVDILCPADRLTPNGTACGLAAAVDEHLADAGEAEVTRFKSGLALLARASRTGLGHDFVRGPEAAAAQYLDGIFAGDLDGSSPLASWAHDVLHPVVIQASFRGPVYRDHGNRVFWKLTGQQTN